MKIKKLIVLTIIGSSLLHPWGNSIYAQSDSNAAAQTETVNKARGGAEKLLLAGEVFTSWQNNQFKGLPSMNSFGADPLGLMLMPLVKLSNRLFLDVQMEVDANPEPGGGASVNLNEAIIYYRVAPALYLFGGNFQPRTGLYEGILDDFTNRFCSDPVGMGIAAQTESGIGIQGGFQAGYSKFNYQLYAANGPQLIIDSTGAQNGMLSYDNYTDNNTNKAIGGSIGFLPFSNSSLEIGASGQYTPKTGDAGTPFENISSTSWVAYLNYYHVFDPIMVRLQGQYEYTQTQNFDLYNPATDSLLFSHYNNQLTGWYAGITLRASGSQNIFISNLELGGRIGALTTPTSALWGGNPINQTTICLTYWYTWKTPINIAYDIYTQSGSPTQTVLTVRGMWFF